MYSSVIDIKSKFVVFLAFIIFLFSPYETLAIEPAKSIDKEELRLEVEKIYNIRCEALTTGNYSMLNNYYDTSKKSGIYALEHEIKRAKYLKDWSAQRNMEFKNIKSDLRVKKVIPAGKVTKLVLEESYRFDYAYKDDSDSMLNSFGVGIRHTTSLTKKDDKWFILSDWYTDCFEDALQSYSADLDNTANLSILKSTGASTKKKLFKFKKSYNRENAVAYADKYCGAAWGSGNNFKYNKKYSDFNGAGGDCTNFISQVLGDEGAGGLPINNFWHKDTRAWSNADGLKNYLIGSGRGSIIKIGTFNQLTAISESTPNGAVSKLQLGDLIAYEKGRGNIDHFAVITGFDSHGYPLVNSHTTDRYHVPWDLGWGDKKIRFFLIHING